MKKESRGEPDARAGFLWLRPDGLQFPNGPPNRDCGEAINGACLVQPARSRPGHTPRAPTGTAAMRWQTSATALASLFTPFHPCISCVWPFRDLTSRRNTQQPCDRIIWALLLGHLLLPLEALAARFRRSSAHKLLPKRRGRTEWAN